ncbi:MAG: YggT family protein [Spirochaetaceae bacterium]|nr:YggT family protein [Spirochaetaceae bacterium]
MRTLMNILGGAANLYMLVIFIRVMLTWFSGANFGRPVEFLCRITDPYLNWFRRFRVLRVANLDLSPIAALAVLSIAGNVFATLGRYGTITLGFILAMIVSALWSAVSFILIFFLIVLALRFIAYLTRQNVYGVYSPMGAFWRIVDSLSQPITYRINRIIFRNRLVRYHTGLLTSIAVLAALRIGLGFLVRAGINLLSHLPV